MTPPPEPNGSDRHEPERGGPEHDASPGRPATGPRPPEPGTRAQSSPQDAAPASGPSDPSGSSGPSGASAGGAGAGRGGGGSTAGRPGAGAKDLGQEAAEGRGPLVRASRQKVVAGVCGGLGRYCDVDPVVFRIVVGVLSVAGGLGMIVYGLAWLLIPLEGEEENEGRKLLSGRVEGAALIAVLLALIGCGLFLSMLGNGGTLSFSIMLTSAVVASAVYSKHRRETAAAAAPRGPAAAHGVSDAPPETKAPPVPGSPSWWRDPIVKDGTTGHYAAYEGSSYLWGPQDTPSEGRRRSRARDARRGATAWGYGGAAPAGLRVDERHGTADIGGTIFFAALVAGGLGTWLSWHTHPLGTTLQIGLAAVLAVLGLGLVVTSFVGRTGCGTVFWTVVTTILLAAATALPDDISTHWSRETWRPVTAASVAGSYRLGSGVGRLDLREVQVPAGATVRTSAHVGGGLLRVYVPAGVALDVRASSTAGSVRLPGDGAQELHISPNQTLHRTYPAQASNSLAARPGKPAGAASRPGTLSLTLDVGLGEVKVTREAS
ncbi:PspC domain-containing protein [Streptomyces fuscigenes]|uniref:PspC domain-containing protein n=1 Tax=Streptomyces fuscigenes TaxID=1528880 RepID=UPI001F16B9B8|nr:PspC domain-containing protein [Streptomyces fuscigenes]MCF3961132.1 PspC domain-containing protein [Streptomyces fuscigenes]